MKEKSIVLVRGQIVFKNGSLNNEAVPSLGLAYISGYLRKKGYKVKIVDATGEGLNRISKLKEYPGFSCQGLTNSEVLSKISSNSDVIAFSAMFSGEWPVLRDLITQTRKLFPNALLVAGGEHITGLTEYSLRDCPALDVCVRGEGEQTFYELLEAHFRKDNYFDVPGISYLDEKNKYRQNGDKPLRIQNINKIPWPDWPENYLEGFWKTQKSYGVATERDMPFLVSRGCPFQCSFCSNVFMWDTRYQFRDISDIIEEIKFYIKRYRITSIQLYDLTAIIKKKWIIDFTQAMIDEGISINWSLPSGTRSEALDKEVLSMLKKTHCNYLVFAPESGSQRTLKKIKKRVKLDRLTSSLMEAKRQGLIVRTSLIIGFPHETWKDIFQTVLYQMKMAIKGVDDVPLYIFSPYPGTEIYNDLLKAGKIQLNDDYFFSLTSLNGDYFSTNVITFGENINGRMLGIVRLTAVLINYSISYLLYPKRIIRSIKNIYSGASATTVFEHRLKDFFNRKKQTTSSTL